VSNLLRRVIVAAIGAPLVVFIAIHGSWPLHLLACALQVGVLWEWNRLNTARDARIFWPGLLVATAGLDAAIFMNGHPPAMALATLGLGVMLLSETFRGDRKPLANLSASALYLLYAALPLALWTQLDAVRSSTFYRPAGALTAMLLATWMCDTGAYFMGRAFGKHKLYVAASPNKTVEGFFGGILFAAVVLPVLSVFGWAEPRLWDYLALPFIVSIIGQCGDLLESLMKREVNVKDTSAFFPGHGGFLDRFDSLLLSTPFFFAYLLLTAN
jgi:phosphatidate cytidylyltransferase